MSNELKAVRLIVCGCAFLIAAAAPLAAWSQIKGVVISDSLHAPALEGNLLGDSTDRGFIVYLPPTYRKSESHYPVIYLLHGAMDTYKAWTEDPDWANIPRIMDGLIASGKIREMIIVMPDADNKFGVPAYTNSVTAGNWEDYIARDLVNYVDTKYRTLPSAETRGIAGHSIGAYGALKLAMKHPEIFGAAYALSAPCLEWDDSWSPGNPSWKKALGIKNMHELRAVRDFVERGDPKDPEWLVAFLALGDLGLSAAWSPNPKRPPFFADFPVERRGDSFTLAQKPQADWLANLLVPMLGQYRSNLAKLRGIAFDIGRQDFNQDLLVQARDLDLALQRNGLRHEFEEYEGTHTDKIPARIATKVLPFFSRVLE